MSEPGGSGDLEPKKLESEEEEPVQGPSLTLMYALVALALALAIGFAWMIVLPFANRR